MLSPTPAPTDEEHAGGDLRGFIINDEGGKDARGAWAATYRVGSTPFDGEGRAKPDVLKRIGKRLSEQRSELPRRFSTSLGGSQSTQSDLSRWSKLPRQVLYCVVAKWFNQQTSADKSSERRIPGEDTQEVVNEGLSSDVRPTQGQRASSDSGIPQQQRASSGFGNLQGQRASSGFGDAQVHGASSNHGDSQQQRASFEVGNPHGQEASPNPNRRNLEDNYQTEDSLYHLTPPHLRHSRTPPAAAEIADPQRSSPRPLRSMQPLVPENEPAENSQEFKLPLVANSKKSKFDYAKWLEVGLLATVALAWRQSKERCEPASRSLNENKWREIGIDILLSMNEDVVKELVCGSLSRAFRNRVPSICALYEESST